jgi:hypothetical protein
MRNYSNIEKYALGIMVKDDPSGMSGQDLSTLVDNLFYGKVIEFIK